jgi:hypothetical protein
MLDDRRRYHPADAGDRQWQMLLAFALDRSDHFECALGYPMVTQDLARLKLPAPLDAFRPQLVERHVSLIRWETRQDYPTQFVRFRLIPPLAAWVASLRRLEHWAWDRGAPEDPTFYRDGEVLLATESRDGRIAVYADDVDHAALTGVGIRLLEPLGVRAEPWPTP